VLKQATLSAAPAQRRSPTIFGVIGTVLVHLVAVQSVMSGAHARKVRPPDAEGIGATMVKSDTAPSETLVLIDLPQAAISDQPLAEELTSAGQALRDMTMNVVSDDPLPHVDIPKEELSEDKDAAAAVDSGDPAVQAAMFGRYTGQIDARIERAWQRPRSPVNPSPDSASNAHSQASANSGFKCQVRIIQDAHGSIQEVQLLACNGSIAWQHSLIMAINASSPLPAPPNPRVFSRSLTMTFTAASYSPSSSADEYELPSTLTVGRQ
jgi:TonB C terminal